MTKKENIYGGQMIHLNMIIVADFGLASGFFQWQNQWTMVYSRLVNYVRFQTP